MFRWPKPKTQTDKPESSHVKSFSKEELIEKVKSINDLPNKVSKEMIKQLINVYAMDQLVSAELKKSIADTDTTTHPKPNEFLLTYLAVDDLKKPRIEQLNYELNIKREPISTQTMVPSLSQAERWRALIGMPAKDESVTQPIVLSDEDLAEALAGITDILSSGVEEEVSPATESMEKEPKGYTGEDIVQAINQQAKNENITLPDLTKFKEEINRKHPGGVVKESAVQLIGQLFANLKNKNSTKREAI